MKNIFQKHAGRNLSKVFDQYLRDTRIPVLEYSFKDNSVQYRWSNVVSGFDMPVKIKLGDAKEQFVYPTGEWKTLKTKGEKTLIVDRNFYVESKERI